MPRNSSGTYSLPAGNPVQPNTLIETAWANPTMSDLGSALTDSLDRYGRGNMLAALKINDGLVTAPGMSFGSEASTGIYRPAAGKIAVAVLGVNALTLDANGLTATKPYLFADGTAAAPSISFASSPATGFLRPGANRIGVAINGAQAWEFAADSSLCSGDSANAVAVGGTLARLYVGGTGTISTGTVNLVRFAANNNGFNLQLGKSRGTLGTFTAVQSGDNLGNIIFYGANGTDFNNITARIRSLATEAFTGTASGGTLEFLVTANGGTVNTTRLTIASDAITAAAPILAPDGVPAAPGISFSAGASSGLTRGSGGVSLVQAGSVAVRVSPAPHVNITLTTAAPTVSNTNIGELAFSRISDTSLRVSLRGNDGTMRTATIALA